MLGILHFCSPNEIDQSKPAESFALSHRLQLLGILVLFPTLIFGLIMLVVFLFSLYRICLMKCLRGTWFERERERESPTDKVFSRYDNLGTFPILLLYTPWLAKLW